jgi:hypothetical protein
MMMVMCAGLVGCNQWNDATGYSNAVFSENGDHVAAVFQTFEEKNLVTHMATRNFSSQVVLQQNNGSLQPLTELMEGGVAELFYQKEAEFLILSRRGEQVEDDSGSEVGWIKVDRIDLDGTVTPLASASGIMMLSCDGGTSKTSTNLLRRFIPNPEGTLLAAIESETTCSARIQTLTFLDAQTLEAVQAPIALEDGAGTGFGAIGSWSPQEMAWMEDGTFAVSSWAESAGPDLLNAQVYTVGQSSMDTAVLNFGCFFPPTASHYHSIAGESVQIIEATGEFMFSVDPIASEFGCPNE